MSERVIDGDGPPRRSDPTDIGAMEFLLTFLIGSLSFAGWLAFTAVILTAEAAPPLVSASILPLLFLSGIFIPLAAPAWMRTIANLFPGQAVRRRAVR